ncbi:MAG TPA: hypothetical protein VGF17_03400 [Phytomonospora sp.]
MDLGRLALARNPALPLDVLERLAEEPHVIAVGTPWARIDDEKLRWLLGLGDEGITSAAAAYGRLSAEQVERLKGGRHDLALAGNRHVPAGLILDLAVLPRVRRTFARRGDLPAEMYTELLTDPDSYVAEAALRHAPLSAEELYRRAVEADPGTGIHHAISGRPDMPPAVRDLLAGSDDVFVLARVVGARGLSDTARARVLDRLGALLLDEEYAPPRMLESSHMWSGCGWLHRVPLAERVEHAGSPFWFLRAEAASVKDLPDDVVAPLWDDPHPFVRLNARLHPSTPGEILTAAAREKTGQGRHTYVTHPNFPRARLLKFAVSKRARLRGYAARHPGLPPGLLADLAADPKPRVAAEARANPSLPPDVMRALVER